MNFTLSNIAPGKWRYFTPAELNTIQEMVKYSSKTENNEDGFGE
jgi:16S rRNA U516 pseudouridylate synthase RsuA-like enzyme